MSSALAKFISPFIEEVHVHHERKWKSAVWVSEYDLFLVEEGYFLNL